VTRTYSAFSRLSNGPDPRFDAVEQAVWEAVVQELERFHP